MELRRRVKDHGSKSVHNEPKHNNNYFKKTVQVKCGRVQIWIKIGLRWVMTHELEKYVGELHLKDFVGSPPTSEMGLIAMLTVLLWPVTNLNRGPSQRER